MFFVRFWTYKQLQQTGNENLKTRARNLQDAIKKVDFIPAEFAGRLRTNGESRTVIRWILEAQAALLQGQFSIADFGFPVDEEDKDVQVFAGDLPSIKRTKKSILATSPKKGPRMHETTA